MISAIALGTLMGALLLASCQKLLPSFLILCLFLIFTLIIYCCAKISQPRFRSFYCFVFGIILGLSWSGYYCNKILAWHLPQEMVNKEVNIKGIIIGEVIHKNKNMKTTIQLANVGGADLRGSTPKIEVSWYKPTQIIKTGDKVEAIVKLKPIHSFSNPGGMDEEKFYFLKGIRAKGSLKHLISAESHHKHPIMAFRMKISRQLKTLFPNEPFVPVISALTIGVKSDLAYDLRDVFQKTGTSHLLAISGLHIGLLATLCFFITRKVACYFPRLLLYQPAMCWAAVCTILISFLYALLAGFSLPTQRALIMIAVVMLGICFKRKVFCWQSYFIAMLLVILFNPLSVFQPGFWLSFLAVFALMLVSHESSNNKIINWLKPQWTIFCMLIPLTILFFNMVSLVSPVANMVAIPIVACIIVPLSLLGVFLLMICEPLAEFCLSIVMSIFSYTWHFLDYLRHIPYASFSFSAPSMLALVLSILGVIIIFLPKGVPGKYLSIILFLPLLVTKGQSILPGELKVSILDVGQGLSVVLETQNHTMLYDTGPRFGRYQNAGNKVITPFLQAYNIRHIDRILISHVDMDHIGGLSGLQNFIIDEIQTSEPEKISSLATLCEKGQSWVWDGVLFEILHPSGEEVLRNNRSCVLKVSTDTQSILLSGDITQSVEAKLLYQHGKSVKSDILIVPHHGSRTSSSGAFIKAVSPEYAIFSAGFNNIYGLPKKDVWDNYANVGAKNLLTCQTGAIIFTLDSREHLTPPTIWRDTAKRIWTN